MRIQHIWICHKCYDHYDIIYDDESLSKELKRLEFAGRLDEHHHKTGHNIVDIFTYAEGKGTITMARMYKDKNWHEEGKKQTSEKIVGKSHKIRSVRKRPSVDGVRLARRSIQVCRRPTQDNTESML